MSDIMIFTKTNEDAQMIVAKMASAMAIALVERKKKGLNFIVELP